MPFLRLGARDNAGTFQHCAARAGAQWGAAAPAQKRNASGTNVTANTPAHAQPIHRRRAGTGWPDATTGGGAQLPPPTANASTAHTHHPDHHQPSTASPRPAPRATQRWPRPSSAYATCPPSSWLSGSRLSPVTNAPTQPANAGRLRNTPPLPGKKSARWERLPFREEEFMREAGITAA